MPVVGSPDEGAGFHRPEPRGWDIVKYIVIAALGLLLGSLGIMMLDVSFYTVLRVWLIVGGFVIALISLVCLIIAQF